MKKTYSLVFLFLMSQFVTSQIVINELDTDTPSTDTQEFIELKSDTPNYSLNNFVVVLFNGSESGGNSSYFTIDLNGYFTDVNGLLLIGSNEVSPVPQLLISPAVIQNGPDAVAIYTGSSLDFPEGTLATTNNLIDALMYDTNDADDTDLMALLGLTEQINEGLNGNKDTESIQRANDGSYFVAAPTPRQLNDGTGIVLNGVNMSIEEAQYNEGDQFVILFTTEQNVDAELALHFTLNNGTFNEMDYTGIISLVIPVGQNTVSTTITLVDDDQDEGDEVLVVSLTSLPTEYIALNDNIDIRVVDNDYVVSNWGTPIDPTFGNVEGTQSAGYYNSLDGLADVQLRQELQDIIAAPGEIRTQTYADIIDILKIADQNPANSNQVWLLYTEGGRAKLDVQTTSNSVGKWNREHTFPRSRGGFFSIEEDDVADGINVYWETNADSLRHGNSDAHALRATDGPENSARGNLHYGEYVGPVGTLGSFKGDVARSVLYMDIRYNGLQIVNGFPDIVGQLGDLTTLLDWHRNDLPDDFEMNRNNVVYTWQLNRNPFIDHPDLVEYFWGNKIGEVWNAGLHTDDLAALQVLIYPNPTYSRINIVGIEGENNIDIFSVTGQRLATHNGIGETSLDLNLAAGIYFIKINSEDKSIIKKIILK